MQMLNPRQASPRVLQLSPTLSQTWPKLFRSWKKMHQHWPELLQIWPKLVKIWTKVFHLWPKLLEIWIILTSCRTRILKAMLSNLEIHKRPPTRSSHKTSPKPSWLDSQTSKNSKDSFWKRRIPTIRRICWDPEFTKCKMDYLSQCALKNSSSIWRARQQITWRSTILWCSGTRRSNMQRSWSHWENPTTIWWSTILQID